jgi:hypothetical protein
VTDEEIKEEIAELERLLKKRKGRAGFNDNVKDIETCLAGLRRQLSNG